MLQIKLILRYIKQFLLPDAMLALCYAVILCLPVCLSVRMSQFCIVWLNIWSRKQCHTIAQDSSFLMPKIWKKFQ